MSVNADELIRCANQYKELQALIAEGLISPVERDGVEYMTSKNPKHPRVIAFLKVREPDVDMQRRVFILWQIPQLIAEAKAEGAPLDVISQLEAFALSIPNMTEFEVAAAVEYFEAVTGTAQ